MHLILATQRPSRRRDHRPHQGQLPRRDRAAGGVEDRLAHHPRSAGRREPARQRRHAVLRSRHQGCAASTARWSPTTRSSGWSTSSRSRAKPVYDMDILKPREEDGEEGGGPADELPRRSLRPGGAPSSARRARRRCRSSSGACRSATTAPRGWSSRWSATASSVRPTAPSRARCWRPQGEYLSAGGIDAEPGPFLRALTPGARMARLTRSRLAGRCPMSNASTLGRRTGSWCVLWLLASALGCGSSTGATGSGGAGGSAATSGGGRHRRRCGRDRVDGRRWIGQRR